MSKGKRYDGERKLNLKKVFAVVIAIAVIIMFVVGIGKLMNESEQMEEKVVGLKYFPVYTSNKWGVINSKGETIIEPTYDEAIVIPDSTKAVFICTYDVNYDEGTYKTKVLNEKNEEIFTGYEQVEAIENYDTDNILWYEKEVLKVKKDGKYGLIDLKGKQIADCTYDSINSLKGTQNSLLTVKEGKKGIVDNTGAVIIQNEYKNIEALTEKYENGYIVQNDNGKYGVMNWSKTQAIEVKYDEVKNIYASGKYYVVKEEGKLEIVDTEGKTYFAGEYDDILGINGDYAIVKKNGKYGVMLISGNKSIIAINYPEIKYASGTNYIVKEGSKYGIINTDGVKLVDFKYTNIVYRDIANFYEANNDDYTVDLLDSDMNLKLEGVIISNINLTDGYMQLRMGDEYKYYNFKFEEKKVQDILKTNTLFLSKKDGKYGFVDKNGVVVVDFIYDDACEQNEFGYSSVKKDGLWGCIDSRGNVKIAPSYKLDNYPLIQFIGKWHLGQDLNLNYFTDK